MRYLLLSLFAAGLLTACDRDDKTFEKAGRKIDEQMDAMDEKREELRERAEEAWNRRIEEGRDDRDDRRPGDDRRRDDDKGRRIDWGGRLPERNGLLKAVSQGLLDAAAQKVISQVWDNVREEIE